MGLTHLPDPAGQVPAVEAQHPHPPRGAGPRPGEGLWAMPDIMGLQEDLLNPFADARP
ncbi:hypothetical protein ACFU9X_32455 [Streptomyces atratus]|uniref:hypothetical protein n=1 Tax=Streptomyces atratus TaxID=1893 RepID=UPI00367DD0E5